MVRRSSDDGRRGKAGVLLSIRGDATEIELTIDHVGLERPAGFRNGNERLWKHEHFVTFLQMPSELSSDTFSKEQLANFGLTVLGCIYASANRLRGEPPDEVES